jgi:hypothetical protein
MMIYIGSEVQGSLMKSMEAKLKVAPTCLAHRELR